MNSNILSDIMTTLEYDIWYLNVGVILPMMDMCLWMLYAIHVKFALLSSFCETRKKLFAIKLRNWLQFYFAFHSSNKYLLCANELNCNHMQISHQHRTPKTATIEDTVMSQYFLFYFFSANIRGTRMSEYARSVQRQSKITNNMNIQFFPFYSRTK